MSQTLRAEVLERLRLRYSQRAKEGKKRLLDEFCDQWGYSRKYAIKLLKGWQAQPQIQDAGPARGRPRRYEPDLARVLKAFWTATDQLCGKRLAAALPDWLPHYETGHGRLPSKLKQQLLTISAASIDRVLAPYRSEYPRKGLCGTRPGSLIKNQIAIRTEAWDIQEPGFLEADTVAHCGDSLAGNFIWSVTYTDIATQWTESAAVWNKGALGILEQTQAVEQRLPFALRGFDCDNGSEFLNWHLIKFLQERQHPVRFTRSRPYHKDDNGHVEQKNWTHVRQLLGYQRLEDPELLVPINRLYRELWAPWHNFFLPSAKLIHKHREGSRWVRRHDAPKTPYRRLLQSQALDRKKKRELQERYHALNPFELKGQIEEKLAKILTPARRSSRPSGSLHAEQTTAKAKVA